ncbi:MAG: hypothetical protein OEV91_10800 [Desulfobulbaceae bacterium]|nr:hypothetical protein [Desulfobulbaceae bacterium]
MNRTPISFTALGVRYNALATEEISPYIHLHKLTRENGEPAQNSGIIAVVCRESIRKAYDLSRDVEVFGQNVFAANLADTVDRCGMAPGVFTTDERKLRMWAKAAVLALPVSADMWVLAGTIFVADVPLNDAKAINYRVLGTYHNEYEAAA